MLIVKQPLNAHVRVLSLREVPLGGTTKQSSWIATAHFAHLAMTNISETHFNRR